MKALRLCTLLGLMGVCWAAAAQPLPASSGVAAALASCRAVAEAGARLACYDAIQQPAPGTAAAARTAGTGPMAATSTTAATSTASTAIAAASPATAAPAQAKPATAAQFGLPPAPPSPPAEMIESRISGRFEGWVSGTRLQLANGQVWEVLASSGVAYDLDRPTVRVKRGFLGSFFIEIDGVSATPRVRRVQ